MTKEYLVMIEGKPHTVTVSDETEALLAAKAAGKASVGLWKRDSGQDISMTKYLIESVEDLSREYLEQVARKHLGVPWVIAETERLVLREFQPGDEKETETGAGPGEKEEGIFGSPGLLREYIRDQYGFYGYGIWAMTEKGSGKIIGRAGVVNLTGEWERAGASDALELGYRVFAPYRRQGFALEACRGVLGWYKEHMDCPLYAKIDASNEASINVIEKLGFSLTDQKYIGSGQWLYLYGWNC